MVGRQYDCLTNPLGAVRFTFDKAVASGSDPASLDRKDWGVADIFRDFLFDNDGLSQVPILTPSTLHVIQPNSLVRFRGMIQDMLGNEFYVGAYKNEETWNTNKFSDVAQFPMGPSPDMRVPGQNTWADSASEGVISTYATSANREKRQRDTCFVSDEMDIQDSKSDLKLNDVFEFIGILAFDTDVKDDKRGENEMTNCFDEEESVNLPSSKVNTYFLLVLGDDELAAHFMLLHLLSKVHLRVDSVAVGKLSLNLSGFDKSSISIFGNRIN
nr:hypothetical protein [Tanacetum cinerariifolium]